MRIVGGKYKGRVLCGFEKIGVRPTSDMARESLFNILQFKINGAKFLDLFSGTGAVGIEALSRGAEGVVFNDSSRESVKLINANLQKINATGENYSVSLSDGVSYLQRAKMMGEEFDFIYIDPPYQSNLVKEVLPHLSGALSNLGVAIIEGETPFDDNILTDENLFVYDKRRYGRAHLAFIKRKI